MRISLLNGSTTYHLAGQAGVAESTHSSVGNLRIAGNTVKQTSRLVRAPNAVTRDLGNLLTTLAFSTVRTFATPAEAEQFAADYDETWPRTGTLVIEPSQGEAGDRRTMANCVVDPPTRAVIGCSVMLDYRATGGAIIRNWLSTVQKVALGGDSQFAGGNFLGTAAGNCSVHAAFAALGGHTLTLVRPPERDCYTHAIGGSTVALFLDGHESGGETYYQADELNAQLAAGEIDTVFLSLGYNQFYSVGDYNDAIARLDDEFVAPFVAAGGNVVLSCIPPVRNFTVEDGFSGAALVAEENAVLWNTALKAAFANRRGILVHDSSSMFAEPATPTRITDHWIGDKIHLPPMGQWYHGRALIAAVANQSAGWVPEDSYQWISANPYRVSGGTAMHLSALVPGNAAGSLSYAARVGGMAGERVAVVDFGRTVSRIGSGDAMLTFTATAAAVAAGLTVHVQIFSVTGAAFAAKLTEAGNYRLITLTLATGTTAAVAAAACEAAPAVAALVTTVAGGTGAGTAIAGTGGFGEVRSNVYDAANALAVADGDLIRAYCEIEPEPGLEAAFGYGMLRLSLWSYPGFYHAPAYCNYQDWMPSSPFPMAPGERMVLATSWVPVTEDGAPFLGSLHCLGAGPFRLIRFGVQRKL